MPSEPKTPGPRLARQAQRSINRAEILDAKTREVLSSLGETVTTPPARDSGSVLEETGGLSVRDLWQLFESQLLSRHLDLAARVLRARGQGFYTIGSSGHEANAVWGRLLRLTDPVFLHYRSGAFMLERARQQPGLDMVYAIALSLMASRDDPIAQGRHKVFGHPDLLVPPQTSTIASHLPKAFGTAALLESVRRLEPGKWPRDGIVFVSFGDASANHSTALGALNAAAQTAWQGLACPLFCLCEDNGLGISVRTPSGWIESNYRNRSGLRYYSADGSDLFEVWRKARDALEFCRARQAPVFFHLRVVRLLGHAGTDAESEYRTVGEIEADEGRDPILKTAGLLHENGLASGEMLRAAYEEARIRVEQATERAVQTPRLSDPQEVMKPLAPYSPAAVATEVSRVQTTSASGGSVTAGERLHLSIAINRALAESFDRYPGLVLFGEDIAQKGGVYTVTSGLHRRYGGRRVFNTLLDEQTILGLAQGGAFLGLLPIAEIQYLAYFHNAEDQIRGEACSLQFFSADQYRNGFVVRIPGLAYQKGFGGHFHNDNSWNVFRDIPGLIVVCPARADDAVGLLRTALALAHVDGRIVVFLEPIALYMTKDLHEPGDRLWLAPYPEQGLAVPLGEPRWYGPREDLDLLVVTYGNGVYLSLRAVRATAAHRRIGVLDLRWLKPLNHEALAAAFGQARRVLVVDEGRRTGSVSEEIVTLLGERAPELPFRRLVSEDSYIPLGPAADAVLLTEEKIRDAVCDLLAQGSSGPGGPDAAVGVRDVAAGKSTRARPRRSRPRRRPG
jgi:2-oxoisovalerate dehydrogenase E1 component